METKIAVPYLKPTQRTPRLRTLLHRQQLDPIRASADHEESEASHSFLLPLSGGRLEPSGAELIAPAHEGRARHAAEPQVPVQNLCRDTNSELADLIGAGLEYEVDKRIQSAAEFEDRLLEAKLALRNRTPMPGQTQRTSSGIWRKPFVWQNRSSCSRGLFVDRNL
jgi:hypothetical protein